MYGIDLSLESLFVVMLCCYRLGNWYLWNGLEATLKFFGSNVAFALSQRCFALIGTFASLTSGLLRALPYPYADFRIRGIKRADCFYSYRTAIS